MESLIVVQIYSKSNHLIIRKLEKVLYRFILTLTAENDVDYLACEGRYGAEFVHLQVNHQLSNLVDEALRLVSFPIYSTNQFLAK